MDRAFSNLDLGVDPKTGEVEAGSAPVLVAAEDRIMLRHYGIESGRGDGYRIWHTVTPAALPEQAARRHAARKPGSARLDEEHRAAVAVMQALRHAGRSEAVETVRVQRKPFKGRGARAEPLAQGTRFARGRLWHAEIAFAEPVRGPLIIGDGRYLGLGLMAPQREILQDTLIFPVPSEAGIARADGPSLALAARRALMALARDGSGRVPLLFSGHA